MKKVKNAIEKRFRVKLRCSFGEKLGEYPLWVSDKVRQLIGFNNEQEYSFRTRNTKLGTTEKTYYHGNH